MNRPHISTLAAMFGGASLLSDREVSDALAAELERERAAARADMLRIIAEARRKQPHLHSGIFDPPEVVARDLAAKLHVRDTACGEERSDTFRSVAEGLAEMAIVVSETSERLRAARLPVSHADPEDYWANAAAAWRRGEGARL